MAQTIPILNVFYLYCYAWRLMREGRSIAVGATRSPDAVNFFGRILLNGTQRLLRRGLDRGYSGIEEEAPTVRGRILVIPSYRNGALQRGRAVCAFDELSHNTLNNRIIKATLGRLRRAQGLQRDLRSEIGAAILRFEGVGRIELSRAIFRQAIVHRQNAHYGLLLKICELIQGQLLPLEGGRGFVFSDLFDDETRMSAVFEEFVRVFLQTECSEFESARREDIRWDARSGNGELDYLPKMQTDVTLRSADRNLIVDAKFYKSVFSTFRGTEKVRSAHLYQMLAYLNNAHASNRAGFRPEGLLLYPSSSESIMLDYHLNDFRVRVATIDLHVEWEKIDERLRQLVAVSGQEAASFSGIVQA